MNVRIEGTATINWSNVNYLNERNSRIYFTSGDWLRLNANEIEELIDALMGTDPPMAVRRGNGNPVVN